MPSPGKQRTANAAPAATRTDLKDPDRPATPGAFRRNSIIDHARPPLTDDLDVPALSVDAGEAGSAALDAMAKLDLGDGVPTRLDGSGNASEAASSNSLQPPKPSQPIDMLGDRGVDEMNHFNVVTPNANASPGRTTDPAGRQKKLSRPIVSYSAAAQQGFRLMGSKRMRLHDAMEDVEWTSEPFQHPISGLPCWILILADGHGGVGAPTFFVNRLKELVKPVLTSREWDFDEVEDRNEFSNTVRTLYSSMDDEYVNSKKLEYLTWREAVASESSASLVPPATTQPAGSSSAAPPPGSAASKKPVDDGCTLILNCVYNGYVVNVNVGDSRTVLGRQPRPLPNQPSVLHSPAVSLSSSSSSTASNLSIPTKQKWTLYFSSVDHSPSHPEKALWVSKNGGIFINDNGTRRNVKIDEKRKKPYLDLIGARILRPLDDNVKAIGVSHLRTLNLASTMGDLLYKIPPAVLSCLPDVSFVRLTPQYEYLLVAATDGLWDHLKVNQGPESQAKSVVGWSGDEWERLGEFGFEERMNLRMGGKDGHDSHDPDGEPMGGLHLGVEESKEEDDNPTRIRTRSGGSNGALLSQLARKLADREKNNDLFFAGWIRVDDAMVVVAHIRGVE